MTKSGKPLSGKSNEKLTPKGFHPRPFSVKTRTPPPQAQYDELLIWVFIALLALGLVMVYSASIATAEASKFTGHQPAYYLLRHGVFITAGLFFGLLAFQVPVQMWQTYAPYLFLTGAALLVLVLIPGIGREVNGSRRWLSLFIINLQHLGIDEAVCGVVCRRLHGAQGQGGSFVQESLRADDGGDGGNWQPAAAGARHGCVCGDLCGCVMHAVAGRLQP